MNGPTEPGGRHRRAGPLLGRIAIGIGVSVGVVVVGVVILLAWAIVTGEQQSHKRGDQVASTYRSTRPGRSETAVRNELGEPSLVTRETIRGRTARCAVYRVLLTARELVPYRFCFVDGLLVSKSRSWDNVQATDRQ